MGAGAHRRRRPRGRACGRAGHRRRRRLPPLRARRDRLHAVIRRMLIAVALVAAFAVGIAVGESLDDSQAPAGTQTLVRTLKPLPLAPAARETVTVTISNR